MLLEPAQVRPLREDANPMRPLREDADLAGGIAFMFCWLLLPCLLADMQNMHGSQR